MPAYPKVPLEDKLAWMRERQRQKEEAARQKEGQALKRRREELAAALEQRERLQGTLAKLHASSQHIPKRPRPEDDLPPERKMLRTETVAQLLSVSVRTVQRWFADRAHIIPTGPSKTTMLISQAALDDWFAEHEPKRANSR